MTIDITKPVQTKDGRKARIICADMKFSTYQLVALISSEHGEEHAEYYTKEGAYWGDGEESSKDLVNVPEKTEEFVLYRGDSFKAYSFPVSNYSLDGVRAYVDVYHTVSPGDFIMKTTRVNGKAISAEIVHTY
jgi:hypothetical protein